MPRSRPCVTCWPVADVITLTTAGGEITIARAGNRSPDALAEIAAFLADRAPLHWTPYRLPDGTTCTVDQPSAWVRELGRVHDRAGIVMLARYASGGNEIIAAAVACPTNHHNHEAELVIQTNRGYAAEHVDPRMRAELVAECQRAGMVLGRVEMVRKWVSL